MSHQPTGISIVDSSWISIPTAIQVAVSLAAGVYAGRAYTSLNVTPFIGAVFCAVHFAAQKLAFQLIRKDSDCHKLSEEEEHIGFKVRTAIQIILPALISPNFTQWVLSTPISWTASLGIPLVTSVAILATEGFFKSMQYFEASNAE